MIIVNVIRNMLGTFETTHNRCEIRSAYNQRLIKKHKTLEKVDSLEEVGQGR